MTRKATLGVGFAAFQDGTYELFIRNRDSGLEWNYTDRWKSQEHLEELRGVFADCVVLSANPDRLLAILTRISEQLPNMEDPDAVPEDPCMEITITWQDWADIKRLMEGSIR